MARLECTLHTVDVPKLSSLKLCSTELFGLCQIHAHVSDSGIAWMTDFKGQQYEYFIDFLPPADFNLLRQIKVNSVNNHSTFKVNNFC